MFFNFSSATCPEGSISVPPTYGSKWSCLYFNFYKRQFLIAEKQCTSYGGYLVSIPNTILNYFISQVASESFSDEGAGIRYWIGVTNLSGNGWKNIDDNSSTTFFDWAPREPNNSISQGGCLLADTLGYWYNSDCYNYYPFVCEVNETEYSSQDFTLSFFLDETTYPDQAGTIIELLTTISSISNPNALDRSAYIYNIATDSTYISNKISFDNLMSEYVSQGVNSTGVTTVSLNYAFTYYQQSGPTPQIATTIAPTIIMVTSKNITDLDQTRHMIDNLRQKRKAYIVSVTLSSGAAAQLYGTGFDLVIDLTNSTQSSAENAGATDNSLGLSSQNFQTQISFISTAVNQINHPERFQFNSGSIIVVPWSNSLSIDDIQNSILKTTQKGNDPYWLRNTLANIYASLSSQTITPPIGAIVFVTKQTTSEDLDGAFQFAKRLQIDGVTLTFVLMGPGIDQGRLGNLTKNFIIWEDLSTNGPDNWDKEYLKAYGCQ
ncbi:hypothetical protein FO519_009105 [Halicephalobus sp. NKZ332]|nr:hypothetical protein FO519_009105 [Halicephalobus sp. NKZ332]